MAGDEGDLRSPQPIDQVAAKSFTSAAELLVRYAAGERDFVGTNLHGGVFDDADLSGVNLQGSDLTEASFRRAVLERADFRDTKGLLPGALAGTNLRGA